MQTLTVYYVGESKDLDKNAYFGHLFGAKSYKESEEYFPKNLKTVIVRDCEEIAFNAFYGCSLTELRVPFLGNTNGENSYLGYVFGAETKEDNVAFVPQTLKKVVLSDGATVGVGAFMGCNHLEEVVLPADMTEVCDNTFDVI